ncbi:MAG: class I SAM-dependent methyltransferase [Terriglobales bacterium]
MAAGREAISAEEHQRFEREFRERELDFRGDRRVGYERQVELEAVVGRLRLGRGDSVLDAGCGVGRITRALLPSGAGVVGCDFALARLQRLRSSEPAGVRLGLVQADLQRLPLAPASFSAIVCTQVLEHIPEAAARRRLIADFHRLLRPGGDLVLTVYNLSETWRRRGAAAEGVHETGIFYHCYTAQELRGELAEFEVVEFCGIVNLLPHTYWLFPRLGPLGRALDHWAERRAGLSQRWGHLLLVHARWG